MTNDMIFLLTLCLFVAGLLLFCFAGYSSLKSRFRLARNVAVFAGILLCTAFILLAWLIAWHTREISEFVEMLANCVMMLGILVGGIYFLFRVQFQKSFQRLTFTSSLARLGNTDFARLEAKIRNEAEARIVLRECKYLAQFFEEREGRLVQVNEAYGDFEGNVRVEVERRTVMVRSIDARSEANFGVTFQVPPHETIVEVHLTMAPDLTSEAYAFDQVHVLSKKQS